MRFFSIITALVLTSCASVEPKALSLASINSQFRGEELRLNMHWFDIQKIESLDFKNVVENDTGLYVCLDFEDIQVSFRDQIIVALQTSSPDFVMPKGLRVGYARRKIVSEFGRPYRTVTRDGSDVLIYQVESDRANISRYLAEFEIGAQSRVSRIRLVAEESDGWLSSRDYAVSYDGRLLSLMDLYDPSVCVGMNKAEILNDFGGDEFFNKERHSNEGLELVYNQEGQFLMEISTEQGGIHTPRGIEVGSSEKSVFDAYGWYGISQKNQYYNYGNDTVIVYRYFETEFTYGDWNMPVEYALSFYIKDALVQKINIKMILFEEY